MANTAYSGTVFIDTSAATVYSTSCKVAYITFTPNTTGDTLALYDGTDTTYPKIVLKHDSGVDTVLFDFSSSPIIFNTSVYATISTSCKATLVLTNKGANT